MTALYLQAKTLPDGLKNEASLLKIQNDEQDYCDSVAEYHTALIPGTRSDE